MNCDMCGRNTDNPYSVSIEGAIMQLCKDCSKFGKVIQRPKIIKRIAKPMIKREEIVEAVVMDYDLKIKNAREKTGLKQAEMANKLSIKESLLHKIESGRISLNIELAKKIEKFLNIQLIEKHKEERKSISNDRTALTIGDVLNEKRKP